MRDFFSSEYLPQRMLYGTRNIVPHGLEVKMAVFVTSYYLPNQGTSHCLQSNQIFRVKLPSQESMGSKGNLNQALHWARRHFSMHFYGFHRIPQDSIDPIGFLQDSTDFMGFRRILWTSYDSTRFYESHRIPQDSM